MVKIFAIGKDLFDLTKSSIVESSAAESEASSSITGFKSSIDVPKFL